MTTLAAVAVTLPQHRYSQAQITAEFADLCLRHEESQLLERLHTNAKVETRHLALPLHRYAALRDFGAANDVFLELAVDLGANAVSCALDNAGLAASDVDFVMSTTVTGIAVPSLDALIASRVEFRPDIKRVPLMGLGCMAGAAGIARLHDLLVGAPQAVGVLVSAELCSLTLQRNDASSTNMVASALFGDGAGAVVAVGGLHPLAGLGPQVVDSRSHLYPDTTRVMGWDVGASGLKVVLGVEIADLVETYLGDDVRAFLAENDLKTEDVDRWISHPGGPKVIEAIGSTLGLENGALDVTWESLRTVGNMSSVSVLHVLQETLAQRPCVAGDIGVLMAMGPGFAAEMVLLRW